MATKVSAENGTKRLIYWIKQTMGPLTRTVWNSTNKTLTMQHRSSSTSTTLNLKTELLNLVYPVGSIYISTAATSPADFLGGTWSIVGTNRVLWGVAAATSAGSTLEEQLPNIKGTLDFSGGSQGHPEASVSGAFYKTANWSGTYPEPVPGSSSTGARKIGFDAKKSNTTYTDNGVVRPAAYTVHMWRRTA